MFAWWLSRSCLTIITAVHHSHLKSLSKMDHMCQILHNRSVRRKQRCWWKWGCRVKWRGDAPHWIALWWGYSGAVNWRNATTKYYLDNSAIMLILSTVLFLVSLMTLSWGDYVNVLNEWEWNKTMKLTVVDSIRRHYITPPHSDVGDLFTLVTGKKIVGLEALWR